MVPIDKLSILVTVAFSSIVLKERLSVKGNMRACAYCGGDAADAGACLTEKAGYFVWQTGVLSKIRRAI